MRWGTGHSLYPIVCDKAGASILEGPLKDINAALANNIGDVLKFITQIGEVLKLKQNETDTYINDIGEFVNFINQQKDEIESEKTTEKFIDDYMSRHTASIEDIEKICK